MSGASERRVRQKKARVDQETGGRKCTVDKKNSPETWK
jgi:hypothetical protein